jgi:protein O-mannosyl-transferase
MTERTKQALTRTAEMQAGGASWKEKLRRPGLVCLLLGLTTLAVFLPIGGHGYVNYDDSDYVTANRHIKGGLKWVNVVWALKSGHASNWHPLTWMSHMLDLQIFGDQPGAQHLVSLGFHIANTLLLFLLLRWMTRTVWRSAMVAALFALHPLHVESVAWVSERKDVLSAFFFLLTLWAYTRYAKLRLRSPEAQSPETEVSGQRSVVSVRASALTTEDDPSRFTLHASRYYLLALLFFALGLMSKPMLVTLPFVLLLLDCWPLQRFQLSAVKSQLSTLCRLVVEKVPFFLLATASSIATFIVQRKGGAVSTSLSLGARVANALVSYVRYIGKMLWPSDLSILYPHPGHWPVWQVIVSAALLLAIFAVLIMLARRRPYLLIGWLWFVGTLVPVIGLVQVGIQSMADRYTYLPLIGLFIMLVWGIADLIPDRPWRVDALVGGGIAGLAVCSLLTVRQVHIWRNSETLFQQAVRVTKDNYLAYNNLGYYLSGVGRTAEAIENYRMSLKINPAYEDALNNLGYALAGQKKFLEAIPLYEAALRIKPKHAEVHNNLGNALSETGKIDEAIAHYLIVLEQNPDHADAHNNLGIALAMKGRLDEAIPHFWEAIRCKPGYASAHSNLGNAFAVQHKLDEAIKEYREALRLKPEDAQAHNNLANALAEQGRVDESIENYREALRLNADNPEAHFNLGIALLRQGKQDQAVSHFTQALHLKPDYVEARRQLDSITVRPKP